MAIIIFQPSGRRGEVKIGLTIVEASREIGVDIEALCGGKRTCGKCKVKGHLWFGRPRFVSGTLFIGVINKGGRFSKN